jgi:hypothetical protein
MVKENQWDWDKARVNHRFNTHLFYNRPTTTHGSPDTEPWVIPEIDPLAPPVLVLNNQPSTICPSLVSCFKLFRRLASFVWNCVWRWPWR